MAHELSHVKNYDIRLMSIVSVMVGLIALLGDWFLRTTIHGRSRDSDNKAGAIILILGLIFAILSPIIAQLIQLSISRRREFMADATGVALTRQPQGLISALSKISADHEPLEAANKATAHLFIENPLRSFKSRVNNLFSTHPSIEDRIRILKSM